MIVGYKCEECLHRWDTGLTDKVCPKCGSEKSHIYWTDDYDNYSDSGDDEVEEEEL